MPLRLILPPSVEDLLQVPTSILTSTVAVVSFRLPPKKENAADKPTPGDPKGFPLSVRYLCTWEAPHSTLQHTPRLT